MQRLALVASRFRMRGTPVGRPAASRNPIDEAMVALHAKAACRRLACLRQSRQRF